jgi:hypothetical protein
VRGGEAFRLRSAPGVRITVADLEPTDAERLADDVADALEGRNRAA